MNKLRILTSQTTPGMKLAEDVYTGNGQLILSAGTTITDKVITRLKFYSIHQITIEVQSEAENEPAAMQTKQDPYSERIRQTESFKQFSSAITKSAKHLQIHLSDIAQNQAEVDEDSLINDVNSALVHARNGMHVLDMMHCMRNYDDETYLHSLNVAMICNVMGRWLNFTRKDLDTLTLCGLLHDIGKTQIPHKIIRKNDKLTEEEYNVVKTHPVRGYNILRAKQINIHVQMAAIMHHERCDGSGYPMMLKSDQIDPFAKIVMIADVYEAMTAARVYRGPLCPFEVIYLFETEGLSKYEPRYLMTFLEKVNQTYLNCDVRLSDKTEGTIIMINPNSLSRPVVHAGNQFIDLSHEPELYIEALL